MANAPDITSDFVAVPGDAADFPPSNPFLTLSYHFGMLLGVDDFETEQAFHRGKIRLHNSWLHGEGAVWGLDVSIHFESDEIRVSPGLALDGAGRELHLEAAACVNVPAWREEHRNDPEYMERTIDDSPGAVAFDAHVVIRFKSCLTRPTPALSEPCEGSGKDTAYSRVFETVELFLRHGPAPDRPAPPYHRLRVLFGLQPPRLQDDGVTPVVSDQQALERREEILALAAEEQPPAALAAFREFAARDEIDRSPPLATEGESTTFYPVLDPAEVVLANITNLVLVPAGEEFDLVPAPGDLETEVDTGVRPSHIATSTIQELLCGCLCRTDTEAAPPPDDEETPDGEAEMGGEESDPVEAPAAPRVRRDTVDLSNPNRIRFLVDQELDNTSLRAGGFSVTAIDENGWTTIPVGPVSINRNQSRVTLQLGEPLGERRIRLIARGTGPTPVLGVNGIPLAGETGDSPASSHDGRDFVHMQERNE